MIYAPVRSPASEQVRNRLLDLKTVLLPIVMEEQRRYDLARKGFESVTEDAVISVARYMRNHARSQECDLGKRYYDVCENLVLAFMNARRFDQDRLKCMQEFELIHGVYLERVEETKKNDVFESESAYLVADWGKQTDSYVVAKIKLSVSKREHITMTIEFVNLALQLQM